MWGVAWSADGREVWFTASEDGVSSDLRAITADGTQRIVQRFPGWMALCDVDRDRRVLLARRNVLVGIRARCGPEADERELGWLDWPNASDLSADGRTLLFDEQALGGTQFYSVCMRGMDGSAPVRLAEGQGCSLSSDGKWALAIHRGSPYRLLLLPTGAGDARSLPRAEIEKYESASWLPDDKQVVFIGCEPGHGWRTYLQDVDGGAPRSLTPEGVTGAFVSPDGRFVACVSPDRKLHAYPVESGEAVFVADLSPDEEVFRWTADGRSLYVGRTGGASLGVEVLDVATGARRAWKTLSVPDPAGSYIRGLVLTPDGRAYAYNYRRFLDDLYLVEGLK
jgi:WD40 repeat protein